MDSWVKNHLQTVVEENIATLSSSLKSLDHYYGGHNLHNVELLITSLNKSVVELFNIVMAPLKKAGKLVKSEYVPQLVVFGDDTRSKINSVHPHSLSHKMCPNILWKMLTKDVVKNFIKNQILKLALQCSRRRLAAAWDLLVHHLKSTLDPEIECEVREKQQHISSEPTSISFQSNSICNSMHSVPVIDTEWASHLNDPDGCWDISSPEFVYSRRTLPLRVSPSEAGDMFMFVAPSSTSTLSSAHPVDKGVYKRRMTPPPLISNTLNQLNHDTPADSISVSDLDTNISYILNSDVVDTCQCKEVDSSPYLQQESLHALPLCACSGIPLSSIQPTSSNTASLPHSTNDPDDPDVASIESCEKALMLMKKSNFLVTPSPVDHSACLPTLSIVANDRKVNHSNQKNVCDVHSRNSAHTQHRSPPIPPSAIEDSTPPKNTSHINSVYRSLVVDTKFCNRPIRPVVTRISEAPSQLSASLNSSSISLLSTASTHTDRADASADESSRCPATDAAEDDHHHSSVWRDRNDDTNFYLHTCRHTTHVVCPNRSIDQCEPDGEYAHYTTPCWSPYSPCELYSAESGEPIEFNGSTLVDCYIGTND